MSGFQIKEIWAFLGVDPDDGDEGVVGFRAPDGSWMPLVCADEARLNSIRGIAERIARGDGRKVVLAKFSQRTDLGEIG